jgi:hypothetical protein
LHHTRINFSLAEDVAELNNSSVFPRILFDYVTLECIAWTFIVPDDYVGSPVFEMKYSMETDTTAGHEVHMDVYVMVEASADIDVTSYDAVNNCNETTGLPAVTGAPKTISCALTNNDGMAAQKLTKLKLCRDVTNDTSTDDVEVRGGLLRYTR